MTNTSTVHEFVEAQDGVYRSAFPSYRVFIYGKEVTQDVLEVRVNQAGGSLERTPGGASFVLVNPNDKYLITHTDMQVISARRSEIDSLIYGSPTDEEIETLYSAEIAMSQDETLWTSSGVSPTIKREVLESKMTLNTQYAPSDSTGIVAYKKQTVFTYPMQEGDCIFHSNDPVRIVFRDPYDPRVWYWMFSGFMDSFLENKGVNKESTVTITCTDVSKILRYSIINIDPGILDPLLTSELKDAKNVSTIGLQIFQQFFAGFNIYEILEILFFGTESWKRGWKTELVAQQIATWTSDEIVEYLIANVPSFTKTYANEIKSYYLKYKGTAAEDTASANYRKIIQDLMVNRKMQEVEKDLVNRNIGMVYGPHGEQFKRASETTGLSAYYIGPAPGTEYTDSSASDEDRKRAFINGAFAASATQLSDLKTWNDKVYHRVVPRDWYDMSKDDNPGMPPSSIADVSNGQNSVAGMITKICTNVDEFPVGCGRVFYLTQSQLTQDLGTSAVEGGLASGNVISHAAFLDRLTLLYDMAERVDFFRFYATPRGDLVFELAFYEYSPEYFTNNKDLVIEYDPSSYMLSYLDIFGEAYNGEYDAQTVQELTKQNMSIQQTVTGYTPINWSNQPVVDYVKEYTIEPYEQINYSFTNTDDGVVNIGYATKHTVSDQASLDNPNMFRSRTAVQRGLVPLLGARPCLVDPLTFIDTDEGAEIYASLYIRRRNAEMRNLSLTIAPKFGLMVNRPLYWKYRNCIANIVSVSHSIVWNSDCSSTVNVNSIRGWGGKRDEYSKKLVHEYFGGDYAFNPSEFVKMAIAKYNTDTGK